MMHYSFRTNAFYRFAIFLGLVVLSISAPAQLANHALKNKLILPDDNHQVNFIWLGDTVSNTWEPFNALLVPVKLKNCPKQFYMQFDLGSPYSLFYSNKIKTIQARYPRSIQLNDSATKLTDLSIRIGNSDITAVEIAVRNFGSSFINWKSRKSIDIIGTIGTDFIENKTLVIDYPGRKILIGKSMPSGLPADITFTDFIFVQNSILLPAVIKKKKTMLYFDTGSSAYELLTSKEICAALADPNSVPVQYKVKSWDRYLVANTVTTSDSIEIASKMMPLRKVTYIEGCKQYADRTNDEVRHGWHDG